MAHRIDMTGQRFGRLAALSVSGRRSGSARGLFWWFVCDCGAETEAYGYDVRRGQVKSCGCLQRDNRKSEMNISHLGRVRPARKAGKFEAVEVVKK
jgi:hypothetical protein